MRALLEPPQTLTTAILMDMNHPAPQVLKTLTPILALANLRAMVASLLATVLQVKDFPLLPIRAMVLNQVTLTRVILLGLIHLTAALARTLTMGIILGRGQIRTIATLTRSLGPVLGQVMEALTLVTILVQ